MKLADKIIKKTTCACFTIFSFSIKTEMKKDGIERARKETYKICFLNPKAKIVIVI